MNGDTVTSASLASAGAVSNAPVSGSPYAITITNALGNAGLTNYTITYTNGSLTVNPASLTVTANPASRTYGAANPAFSATYSGFVNGETVGVVSGAPAFSTPATATSPVGNYGIRPSLGSLTAANYSFGPFVNGTLTVNGAALTITADAQSKTYGQTVVFGSGSTNFTTTVLQNGDTVGTVTLSVSGNGGAATAPVSGSPYTITPSAATGGTFSPGNYAITYDNGRLTVTLPILSFMADPPNLILSWTTNASAFVLSGTDRLGSPSIWTPVTNGIATNGTSNTITINARSGNQYYELIAP